MACSKPPALEHNHSTDSLRIHSKPLAHGSLSTGMFDAQEGDFVEVASTVMEAWATKYEFLSRFARQIETGEPIPKWVVDFNNELAAASGPGVFTMDQVKYT